MSPISGAGGSLDTLGGLQCRPPTSQSSVLLLRRSNPTECHITLQGSLLTWLTLDRSVCFARLKGARHISFSCVTVWALLDRDEIILLNSVIGPQSKTVSAPASVYSSLIVIKFTLLAHILTRLSQFYRSGWLGWKEVEKIRLLRIKSCQADLENSSQQFRLHGERVCALYPNPANSTSPNVRARTRRPQSLILPTCCTPKRIGFHLHSFSPKNVSCPGWKNCNEISMMRGFKRS